MGKQDASEDGESRAAEGKSSKRRKHLKRTPEVHQCHIDIIRGVKDEDVEAGMGAIRRMVSHGVIPDKDSCTAVLSILVTSPVRWDYVSELMDLMAKGGNKIEEGTSACLMKLHLQEDNIAGALDVYRRMDWGSRTEAPKRRSIQPLLLTASRKGDIDTVNECLEGYRGLDINLESPEFKALIEIYTRRGDRKAMAGVLEDMSRLLYSGVEPEFLDLLQTWFAVDCRIGAEVKIGSSGKCPHCKESLQSVELDNKELGILVREMEQVVINYMDGRESASSTQSNVFADGRTHQGIRGRNYLDGFIKFIRDQGGFDFIVDGANVGFFMSRGKLRYSQIDRVVQSLSSRGRVLVILHAQHLRKENMRGRYDFGMTRRWMADGNLWVTPPGMNDDWFWLIGGLISTSLSPTRRAFVVTNDEMTDHHSQLSQLVFSGQTYKRFLTWRERHWATFTFDGAYESSPPLFSFPPRHSICIQSKPTDGETGVMGQLMQGGNHDDYLSRAWHFPINDQERFVEGVLKAPTQALGSGGKGSNGMMDAQEVQVRRWLCMPPRNFVSSSRRQEPDRSQKEVDGLDTWARGYHTCTAAGINASIGVAATRMGGAFGWGMLHVGKSVPPRHLGAASGGLMPFFGGSRGARGMSLSGRAQTKLVVMSHPGTALCPALVSFAASFVGRAAMRR